MKAVVMAGGEGSRLRPVTGNRPKPLAPICNVPIMEHIVRHLARHGVTEVVATLHYLAHEIQGYFGDGSDFGVDMRYSIEDTPLGTAGSVKQAEEWLKDGTFVIVSGDALTDVDLEAALKFHKEKGSIATLVLFRAPNPLEFGVVITDEDGRIQRFLEKPSWSEVFSDTVNTGMYILEPEVFDRIPVGKQFDWSQNVFPQLLEEGAPMYGHVMEGYWADVGSLTQYREAQEHLLARRVNLPIEGDEITPGVRVGPGCSIDPGAVIVPPVQLGRSCKIKAGARVGPYTVIGDHAFIDEDATVERSVVWDSAYIGPSVGIHSAICCSRVTIKRDCQVMEEAVVGDRCLLDVGAVIRPRVKLWPDKVIERGSTVNMSLIWGAKWRGAMFRDLGVAGLSNIEITPEYATRLGASFGSLFPSKAKIVTSRDNTRSSRMIKRAIIASLLGVGCDVMDMQGAAAPVVRHYIKASGAAGGVHVRKLPGNARVTLVEFFDANGTYVSREVERKIENTFSREDFSRTDPDDLGVLETASRALESYQDDFLRILKPVDGGRKFRLVCDFGYSPIAAILPSLLAKFGVETISLNTFNDAKLAPRSPADIDRHAANLRDIVDKLGCDIGALFYEEGERLTLVDDDGRVLDGHRLLGALALAVAESCPGAKIALKVTAPEALERELEQRGASVIRTKADTRALMAAGLEPGVTFAADERGGAIFPEIHPGFDAMYAIAKLVTMLQQAGRRLSDLVESTPEFAMAYEAVRCAQDSKGAVMRSLAESAPKDQLETFDGLKIREGEGYALILPDAFEPLIHVYAECGDAVASQSLAEQYVEMIAKASGAG